MWGCQDIHEGTNEVYWLLLENRNWIWLCYENATVKVFLLVFLNDKMRDWLLTTADNRPFMQHVKQHKSKAFMSSSMSTVYISNIALTHHSHTQSKQHINSMLSLAMQIL